MDGGAGHCPEARGAAVQAACGLLGSGEDADGVRIFPFRAPWRQGFRGVWSAAGASAPYHGTRERRPCCRRTVTVWMVMGVAGGEERPQAAERRTALSSHRWAE